ncbi:MAG: hypothetical protein JKY15_03845, partial [Deltaproteobacteria bacterium]|nr:hypothetical protein [Deltaproteobacteria bacterium]
MAKRIGGAPDGGAERLRAEQEVQKQPQDSFAHASGVAGGGAAAVAAPAAPAVVATRVRFEVLDLSTDSKRLSFLLKVQQAVPNLFKDAANYDINLFDLAKDQGALVEHLAQQQGYAEAMNNKKQPVSIKITPPREGITVQARRIKQQAIDEWKAGLTQTLLDTEPENAAAPTEAAAAGGGAAAAASGDMSSLTPLQHLNSQIEKLSQSATVSLQIGSLLNPAVWLSSNESSDKKKREEFARDLQALEDNSPHGKLLHLKTLYPNNAKIPEVDAALKTLDSREQLARLAELCVVLSGEPEPQTWGEARQKVGQLNAERLIYLDDKEDVLKHLEPNHTDLVFKRIHHFASQEESSAQRTTTPVHLREMPPGVAIFRGCVGGDCSSQYSFP